MNTQKLIFMALLITGFFACKPKASNEGNTTVQGPSKVELKQTDSIFRLYVNGKEFYVKGAGCEHGPIAKVALHQGNSIRTWRTDNAKEVLDEAQKNGLMVMMGLEVARERHGFDYNDTVAVAAQLDTLKAEVLKYKDHPALLGWGIGNELNLRYTNKKVWDAVDDIAKMIKELDGNHVTTTMLAGIGKDEVDYIKNNCPNIDFLSIQMYGDVINLKQRIDDAGYKGPYLVTEWGATGHWEMPSTEWGSPIEQTSSEKADAIKARYEKAILADQKNCLGSYIFLWGQKQERTPSWYGLFTELGEKTEAINVMEYFWSGKWPQNMAPRMLDIKIEGKGGRFDNVKLNKNKTYSASFVIEHPDKQSLKVRAEILAEPTELSDGGDFEKRPETIEGLIIEAGINTIKFKTPTNKGAYRLFVYVTDQNNNAATANIPFFVY